MRILYVEDNETNQALVERVVRAKKHQIVFCEEGEAALELLAADSEVNLILLDIELAGHYSGLDVIKALRERQDHRPVVALTAYAMMGDRERVLAAGCDQYLPKPIIITDLLTLLDHYETELAAPAAAAPTTPPVTPTPVVEPVAAVPTTPLATPTPIAESVAAIPTTPPATPAPSVEPVAAIPTTPLATPAPIAEPVAATTPPSVPVPAAPVTTEPVPSAPTPEPVVALVSGDTNPKPESSPGDKVV
ncbi:MAG TPA: response regulator [Aggregatilineaceae bacterium]|nr:response regulator [Aggregatilineaceae bacterium]